jgi:hypothetical protein
MIQSFKPTTVAHLMTGGASQAQRVSLSSYLLGSSAGIFPLFPLKEAQTPIISSKAGNS